MFVSDSSVPGTPYPRLGGVVSLSVFLFFALMFAVRSGYSYGAGLLLLSSIYFLAQRPRLQLERDDKWLIACLLALCFVGSAIVLWHGNTIKHIDQLSRYALAVPVFLLLLHVPPTLKAVWAGVVLGIVLSVGIAAWQLYGLGHNRASGYLNIIHFGNIGMVFGLFCLCGMLWAGTLKSASKALAWRLAFAVGAAAAVYAIIASGSRGSWVAIPPVALLFVIALATRRTIPYLAAGLVIVVLLAVAAYLVPETGVAQRLSLAISEVQRYLSERYVFENGEVSSVGARLEIWRVALLLIPEHPWLGWSESAFNAELQRLIAAGNVDPYMLEMANTHNNYLEIQLFFGLPTLLCLLALYVVAFVHFARHLRANDPTVRALALAGSSFVAAYFVFGQSQVILGRNNGVMFFVLALVILWACLRQARGPAALTSLPAQ
jgi:O-antigen ligase